MKDLINESFLATLVDAESKDIAIDVTEIAFDAILSEGTLKELPVIGWIFKGFSTYSSISDKIFAKKVVTFLSKVSGLSQSERTELFDKLERQGKKRQEVGETVLVLINNADSFEKARYLGVLMKSLSRGIIDYQTFIRFSSILNRSVVDDLKQIISFQNGKSDPIGSTLQSLGLVVYISYFENKDRDENQYRTSPMGYMLFKAFEGFM